MTLHRMVGDDRGRQNVLREISGVGWCQKVFSISETSPRNLDQNVLVLAK